MRYGFGFGLDMPPRRAEEAFYGILDAGADVVGATFHNWIPSDAADSIWLRADMNTTTVDATVASPNNLSSADWNKSQCTATADTLTDTNDAGIPTTHYCSQLAIAGLQLHHVATVSIEATADTLSRIAVQIGDDGALAYAFLDLSNGTLGTVSAGIASVTSLGGGWYRLTLTNTTPTTPNIYIIPVATDGLYAYPGDGTGKVKVRNITVEQHTVSTWNDSKTIGTAHNPTQATAAKRPALYATSGPNATACVEGDGVDDELDADYTLNQPVHRWVVAQMLTDAADANLLDGAAINHGRFRNVSGAFYLTAGAQVGPSNGASTDWHFYEIQLNNLTSKIATDGGSYVTGIAGTNDPGGISLFGSRGAGTYANARIAEIVDFASIQGAGIIANMNAYLRNRYSL